jgi:serine/threonine protein phosphatase PrpC
MRFSIFQDTDIGARANNQDRMGYCFTRDSLLMLVADGMGGHLKGEVAAQIATQIIASLFNKSARPRLVDPHGFLDFALREAHRETLKYQVLNRLPEAPRTTIVACIVQDGQAWWAHAGDSRLYWLRGSRLQQRTRDHSKVESLVAMGVLKPHEQMMHPERNKVLSCLGSPFQPLIEFGGPVELAPGDRFLLCSDGVWSAFAETTLCNRVGSGTVSAVVPALVEEAVRVSGRMADNATALLMSWEDQERGVDTMSAGTLAAGGVTSTIVFDDLAADVSNPLSEDDIDRTISEIRSAIGKSSKHRA